MRTTTKTATSSPAPAISNIAYLLWRARRVHTGGGEGIRVNTIRMMQAQGAADPELICWVHATLVYSSLAAYERFVHPLKSDEKEQYHEEMNLVARLFGTPAGALPRTYREFRAYFETMLDSTTITVTRPARAVAETILAAPVPAPLRLLVPAHRLSTARILPAELRSPYGLRWTSLHDLALPLVGASVRYTTGAMLSIVKHFPAARSNLRAA